ncbi:MAG: tRNA (adenosine(37)-N6)-threonylcarbamoyltransferase complex ATPase subunit type 1 TsaE [Planctomycetota bacterium]|nr:MAG: tRNA (adenosine(37)-N6)-threonylcarbamoyltransferase complex ATPase subunit type 1 TsaE [Planctomycetota bacterium]
MNESGTIVRTSRAPAATEALGRALGGLLRPGDFLALRGELGAGKTTFTRGLAAGLGVRDRVTSPSYLLCHEYAAPTPLLHLDAYFAERMEEVLAEGLAERFPTAVVVVEWADRMESWLPPDRIEVRLSGRGEERRLELRGLGPEARRRLAALAAAETQNGLNRGPDQPLAD